MGHESPIMKAWRDFAMADPEDCDREWAAYLALLNGKDTALSSSPMNSTQPLHDRACTSAAAATASPATSSAAPPRVPRDNATIANPITPVASRAILSAKHDSPKGGLSPEARRLYGLLVGDSVAPASTASVHAPSSSTKDCLTPEARRIYDYLVGDSATPAPAASEVSTMLWNPMVLDVAPVARITVHNDTTHHRSMTPATCSTECSGINMAALSAVCLTSDATPACLLPAVQVGMSSSTFPAISACGDALDADDTSAEEVFLDSENMFRTAPILSEVSTFQSMKLSADHRLCILMPTRRSTISLPNIVAQHAAEPPKTVSVEATTVVTTNSAYLDDELSVGRVLRFDGATVSAFVPWPPPSCTRARSPFIHVQSLYHHAQQKRGKEFLVVWALQSPLPPPLPYVTDSQRLWNAEWLEVREDSNLCERIKVVKLKPPWPPPLGMCVHLLMESSERDNQLTCKAREQCLIGGFLVELIISKEVGIFCFLEKYNKEEKKLMDICASTTQATSWTEIQPLRQVWTVLLSDQNGDYSLEHLWNPGGLISLGWHLQQLEEIMSHTQSVSVGISGQQSIHGYACDSFEHSFDQVIKIFAYPTITCELHYSTLVVDNLLATPYSSWCWHRQILEYNGLTCQYCSYKGTPSENSTHYVPASFIWYIAWLLAGLSCAHQHFGGCRSHIMEFTVKIMELQPTKSRWYPLPPAKPHNNYEKCNLLWKMLDISLASSSNLAVVTFKQPCQLQLLMVGEHCNPISSSEAVLLFSYRLLIEWPGVLLSVRASFHATVQNAKKLMGAEICSLNWQNSTNLQNPFWNGWSSLSHIHVYVKLELGGAIHSTGERGAHFAKPILWPGIILLTCQVELQPFQFGVVNFLHLHRVVPRRVTIMSVRGSKFLETSSVHANWVNGSWCSQCLVLTDDLLHTILDSWTYEDCFYELKKYWDPGGIELQFSEMAFLIWLVLPWDPGGFAWRRLEDKPNSKEGGLSATSLLGWLVGRHSWAVACSRARRGGDREAYILGGQVRGDSAWNRTDGLGLEGEDRMEPACVASAVLPVPFFLLSSLLLLQCSPKS